MKIQLTKEGLKVGKWECKDVTVVEMDDYFELSLHDIKGLTERIPQYYDDGKPKLKYPSREQEIKILKLRKELKVKNVEFLGIIPKLIAKSVSYGGENIEGKDSYHSINKKEDYINFYKIGDTN